MNTNPLNSLSSIFSEISQQWSSFGENEDKTKATISALSLEVISFIQHPREKGLRAAHFFELTKQIVHLRNSPLGKENYANCKDAILKIEEALERYGKKSQIGTASITKHFKNDKATRRNLNVLIETFKENGNEKAPLSIVYKLQNLPILPYPKEVSIFVSMLHKAPNKLEYLDLILNHLEAGDGPLLHELNKKSDGGFNLLKNASPVLFAVRKLNRNQSLFSEPAIHKLFILKTMALFIDTDQTPDTTIFIELLSNKTLNRKEQDLLKILTRIPTENRIPALQHAVKFFSSDLGIWEKFTYVLEVSLSPECKGDPLKIVTLFKNLSLPHYFLSIENIHHLSIDNEFRKEIIQDSFAIHDSVSSGIFRAMTKVYSDVEQSNNKALCKILNVMFKIEISKEKRLLRFEEIKKIYPYLTYALEAKEVVRSLYTLSQTVNDADMRDIMQNIHRLFNENMIDLSANDLLLQPYSLISSLLKEERDPFIDMTIKAAKYLDAHLKQFEMGIYFGEAPKFEKKDLLTVMMLFSSDERDLLFDILPEATFIFDHFPFQLSSNFALEFSLFLSAIKDDKNMLHNLKSGHLRKTLSEEVYVEKILESANKKLINIEGIPKDALLALCHYLSKNQTCFNLFEEHPTILHVMDFFSLADTQGLKSPFVLYKKLLELSQQPVTFQPQPVSIAGHKACFKMKTFEEMSLNTIILREDIPKEATLEAFNLLFSNLSLKYKNNSGDFKAALKELNPDLSWTKLSLNGPLITLRGLLTLTDDPVNEVEAKWRMILANILSKSTEHLKDSFFTEQEKVLITTQYVIQACSIGIRGGIEDAFQSLPLAYKTKCLSFKTNSDILLEKNQKDAIEFLECWMKEHPDSNFEELCLLLMKESLYDSKTISKQLFSLIGYDLSLWDVSSQLEDDPLDDPNAEWHLNIKGAKTAMLAGLNIKEQVDKLLIPILRGYVEGLFNRGNDDVIKHFIGDIEIKQGVHQALYVKHLIGHALGLPKRISLDPYASNIYEELTKASVNEMLEVFFEKHPLDHFVKEVIRVINQDPETYKKALPVYFDRPDFWKIEGDITLQGALELFIQSGFMVIS